MLSTTFFDGGNRGVIRLVGDGARPMMGGPINDAADELGRMPSVGDPWRGRWLRWYEVMRLGCFSTRNVSSTAIAAPAPRCRGRVAAAGLCRPTRPMQ